MRDLLKYIRLLLPFSNEIANALTISEIGPFKRLYKPCDLAIRNIIFSGAIDFLALFGIIWNVAYMGSKHGSKMGCIYGLIIILLSFIIPNILMEPAINSLCKIKFIGCTKIVKLLLAVGFIILLLSLEIFLSHSLEHQRWRYNRRES